MDKLLLLGVCGIFSTAHANGTTTANDANLPAFYRVGPATIECVIEAARRQGVPANVLLALASVEGGKNGAMVDNRRRSGHNSDDVGHFQINSQHFRKTGVLGRAGIQLVDVAWRGCYNAEIAGWMLRREIASNTGQDYWTRVANYHSRTPQFNAAYRKKVIPAAVKWGEWLERSYGDAAISYK